MSQYAIGRVVQVGVAVWLFLTARRGKETPWVWALLGLTYGVFAALLFFVLRMYNRLEGNDSANQALDGTA